MTSALFRIPTAPQTLQRWNEATKAKEEVTFSAYAVRIKEIESPPPGCQAVKLPIPGNWWALVQLTD